MRGWNTFRSAQAGEIRGDLEALRKAEPWQQKAIRTKLRAGGFYISDFHAGNAGFTRSDFDELVRRGEITIIG
jgi:hypothetical protein